jgi:hypothetical protein
LRYIVKASSLNLRSQPRLTGLVLAAVARDTLLITDLTVDGDLIVGYDDPTTPEPARQTRAWGHVTSYTPPQGQPHSIDAYASLAWVVAAPKPLLPLTFLHAPRITPVRFARALHDAHSPAINATTLYLICVNAGIDPAVALAFFQHESSYGTDGAAVHTRNWGNMRRGEGRQAKESGGWAWYITWEASLTDWCAYIKRRYVERGLTTVEQAIPIYAPSSDHNKPDRYIAAVRASVAQWQQETV